MKPVAIGGSSANPPHLGHLRLVEALLESNKFSKVFWVPSGERETYKRYGVTPEHRVAMTHLLFPSDYFYNYETDFFILFDEVYGEMKPAIERLEEFRRRKPLMPVIWFTGADSFVPQPQKAGKSQVETDWTRGLELINHWHFLVLGRESYPSQKQLRLPKSYVYWDIDLPNITSTDIRVRIALGQPFEHLTGREVAYYIKKHQLYLGLEHKNG